MKNSKKLFGLLAAAAFLLQIGCSSPISSLMNSGNIKLSIRGVATPATSPISKTTTAVTITDARIVIDKIEFERHDDLFDFELKQPFVHDLVGSTVQHEIGTFQLPFGTYEELEIEIDQLGEGESALAQNPELQNLSIRIQGFLNGDVNDTFVFTSDLSAEQEKDLDPPITIDENSPTANIVLNIEMSGWFVDASNNAVDPRIADNKSIIEGNIKASIQVFEDEDDDDEDDDGDEDEDD